MKLVDLQSKEADIAISEIRDRFGDFVAVTVKDILAGLPDLNNTVSENQK